MTAADLSVQKLTTRSPAEAFTWGDEWLVPPGSPARANASTGLLVEIPDQTPRLKIALPVVGDETVTDERATITRADLGPNGAAKLSLGRKKHVLLKAV